MIRGVIFCMFAVLNLRLMAKDDIQDDNLHIVFSKDVIEFVTVANEFCALLEKAHDFSKEDFVKRSQKLLPLLYFKAAVLPAPEESTDEPYEKFVTEADWHYTEQRIIQKLGETELFITMTNPTNPHETEEVSLSECYADIYQDLKDFTMLYQVGSEGAVNEAMWELKENFEQVWGPRLLALLKELHDIIFSGESLDDEETAPHSHEHHHHHGHEHHHHHHSHDDDEFRPLDINTLFGK